MFVNLHPPSPPPNACQALPPFLDLGDGNVSCLQIRSDRLAAASLRLHVETCQWLLESKYIVKKGRILI